MSESVAARYSRAAGTYESMWSPIIRPMAAPLIDALAPLDGLTLDVGCGVGALFADLRRAGGHVIGLDRSEGMAQRAARRGPVACADAGRLPVADGVAATAVAVFMLHHMPEPAAALAELARVVARGGSVGTATWGEDAEHEAGNAWDDLLTRYGAPAGGAAPDSRAELDDDAKATAMMAAAGLTSIKAWTHTAEHRYSIDELCDLHERYGRRNERLLSLPPDAQTDLVATFRRHVEENPDWLVWRPSVVYAVARF